MRIYTVETDSMPRFELKHSTGLIGKSPTKEEKTPIISKGAILTDHGSIAKESPMSAAVDSKSSYDSLIGADTGSGEDLSGPPRMTLLRKLCFLLSLNGGVVYVATLLWWIPCRHPQCMSQQNWTVNISDQLTTNMEIKPTLLSSVLFGFSDENGGHLASLAVANGTMDWNRSTENILKNVFCHLDSSEDGIPDCVATAFNYIGAFNASNGIMLWEKNITDPSDVIIRKVVLAGKSWTTPFLMAISDEELFAFVAKNGTLMTMLDLPCSGTVGMKLVGSWPTRNGSSWILVCDYGDSLEVWTFLEQEVLSIPEDYDEGAFRLLFRGNSNVGSIDLACDVTRTPNSLALSWADSVVMVTEQAPFHHLRKTWERRFGDAFVVTSVVSGFFTTPKEIQVAVTVKEGSNSSLHILDSINGSMETVTSLGMRSVMSMKRISGGKDCLDTLVIESTPTEKEDSASSDARYPRREYFTLKYVKNTAVFESIVTLEASSCILSQFAEDSANLLIENKTTGSGTVISRYVLTNKSSNKCG